MRSVSEDEETAFQLDEPPRSKADASFMLDEPPTAHSFSVLKLQAAARALSAKKMLEKVRAAAILLQSLVRGWVARARVRRWRRAGNAVIAASRWKRAANERAAAAKAASGSKSPMLAEVAPLLPPPVTLPPPGEMTDEPPMPFKSKSQMITLRLQDNTDGLQTFDPSHFDIVAQGGCALQDALYESGKRHFSAGHLERALVDFTLVLRQLERLERRAARSEERRPSFDAEATGFRNLDECEQPHFSSALKHRRVLTSTLSRKRTLAHSHTTSESVAVSPSLHADLDKCTVGIQRRKRRAMATVLDQRALLAGGGDPANPTFWNRLHANCLRCLTSVVEVTDLLGKVKRDLAPPPAPGGTVSNAAPRSPTAAARRKSASE